MPANENDNDNDAGLERLLRLGSNGHLVASLAVFTVFLVWVLPEQAAESAKYTDQRPPDLHFVYTPDMLHAMLTDAGQAGRAAYVRSRYAFDVVWPLAYTYLFLVLIARFARRAFSPGHAVRSGWPLIAVAPFALDMFENLCTGIIASHYPQRLDALAWMATVLTASKWTAVLVATAVVLVSGWMALRRGPVPSS